MKGEVICAAPADEEALMTAIGQGHEAYKIGAGVVTSLDGLASTTINNRYETTRTQYDQVEDMEIRKIEDRSCYKYGKRGHLAAQCCGKSKNNDKVKNKNTKTLTCHYCGKGGHKRPECRKLERDKKDGKVLPNNISHTKSPRMKKADDEEEAEMEFGDDACLNSMADFHAISQRKACPL